MLFANTDLAFWFALLIIGCGFNLCYSEKEVKNETFVMKINKDDQETKPKFLYDAEVRTLETTSDTTRHYEEYPGTLALFPDILEKLKNSDCQRDTKEVLKAIQLGERWALQLVDSSPKLPIGILHGTFFQLGNFDECVETRQPVGDTSQKPIVGQYCLVEINRDNSYPNELKKIKSYRHETPAERARFNGTLHWGICTPSSCSADDAKTFVSEMYKWHIKHPAVNVYAEANQCYSRKNVKYSILEIIYGSIVGFILVIIIMATALHYWCLRRNNTQESPACKSTTKGNSVAKQVIFSFSLIQTVSKLLDCKRSDLNLECIYGIKFISMLFIICAHTLLFSAGGPVVNTEFFTESPKKLENGIFTNNPLLVDTFLLISGFLMCRLLLVEFEKRNGRINFAVLYVARYIRLTPSYLVVIGLYCTFLTRLGDGPMWQSRVVAEQERCKNSWWTNILYINNYVGTENLCMFQSWYLAVDYHLYIIAPFLIYCLWKWKKLGETLLGVAVLLSTIVPFLITYFKHLDPTLMAYAPEMWDIGRNFYFVNAYIKTHMRAGSYCFGLLFGYLVHRLQKSGTKIKHPVLLIGWIFSTACGVFSMFSVIVFYNSEHETTALESAVYAALHRVGWCICIGWIMGACITGHARIVNMFLSWKPFVPLSRLTYSAYLVNGLIEIYSSGTLRQPTYMSVFELGSKILSHLALTFGAALLLCIAFESPIHGLEKILLSKEKQTRMTKNSEENNANIQAIEES